MDNSVAAAGCGTVPGLINANYRPKLKVLKPSKAVKTELVLTAFRAAGCGTRPGLI